MRLATWNVNSIRSRQTHVRSWLQRVAPDLLLLQEIKCEAAAFPDFSDVGYRAVVVGQKSYNGVAVLSRLPVETRLTALPGLADDDAQARYAEVALDGITVGNLYLPNGNSGGEAGYAYKLRWMECLAAHAGAMLAQDQPLVLAGDYNVCPEPDDLAPGVLPPGDALVRPETRARFRALRWLGLADAVRELHPNGPIYTFWDYQAGCWPRDRGLRIDHALLSPTLAERLVAAVPDRQERAEDQPSDHVPVLVEIA
ncbi:MAG TPA: exodeoxyribonuclease III [Acetobacteraceae bacterium]|nr:exodeoxyribonuclease III [Acetobacteraceae bacterium]